MIVRDNDMKFKDENYALNSCTYTVGRNTTKDKEVMEVLLCLPWKPSYYKATCHVANEALYQI